MVICNYSLYFFFFFWSEITLSTCIARIEAWGGATAKTVTFAYEKCFSFGNKQAKK